MLIFSTSRLIINTLSYPTFSRATPESPWSGSPRWANPRCSRPSRRRSLRRPAMSSPHSLASPAWSSTRTPTYRDHVQWILNYCIRLIEIWSLAPRYQRWGYQMQMVTVRYFWKRGAIEQQPHSLVARFARNHRGRRSRQGTWTAGDSSRTHLRPRPHDTGRDQEGRAPGSARGRAWQRRN